MHAYRNYSWTIQLHSHGRALVTSAAVPLCQWLFFSTNCKFRFFIVCMTLTHVACNVVMCVKVCFITALKLYHMSKNSVSEHDGCMPKTLQIEEAYRSARLSTRDHGLHNARKKRLKFKSSTQTQIGKADKHARKRSKSDGHWGKP